MKTSIYAIKMVIKEFPSIIFIKLFSLFSGIIKAIIPIYIINYIVSTYNENNQLIIDDKDIIKVLSVVGILFLVLMILNYIDFLLGLYNQYIERNFEVRISLKFYNKISNIDYDFHESPEFLNDYIRSLENGSYHIILSANSSLNLLILIGQCMSVLTIILSIHYSIIIFVLVIGILYFILRRIMSKMTFKYQTIRQPYMRQTRYSNRAFSLKDSIPDIKTTKIEKMLLDNNDNSYEQIIKAHDKIISKRSIFAVICDILLTLLYPGIVGVLCYFTLQNLDIAAFASLTVAVTTLSNYIANLAQIVGTIQDANEECKVPFSLLKRTSSIEGIQFEDLNEDFNNIKIENISFSYNKKRNVINNVSMEINKGEKIAIVGINGAGKTTLVKLLLRLYDVDNGSILINGKDYKNTTVSTIRNKVGAVFQNIEVYAVTVAENILLREVKNQEDIDLVNEALKFAGIYEYIYSLKDNINTVVTREFSSLGIVFSGGQTQKLAIARGYAQNYQLFILDEPSSALDPLAEAKVYDNMLELGKNRTMIFISHRLTTTVNADRIYLFENGEIIEQGTHKQLIALNKKYKKMFDSQAVKYLGGNYEE